MPFELLEVTSDSEFKPLIEAEWDSYEHPYTRILNTFFPIKGNTPEAHAERIADSRNRQLEEHRKSPASHWFKVIDTETQEIVGGAQWFVFEENPYATSEGEDHEITWWPVGEDREFVTALMAQFVQARMTYMQKPHMHLEACFTIPRYRRRGVGKMIMDAFVSKADEMGMESFIDATELGAILYQKHGFVTPGWVHIHAPVQENPSARWEELKDLLLPLECLPQWRPVGGRFDENTKKPWVTSS